MEEARDEFWTISFIVYESQQGSFAHMSCLKNTRFSPSKWNYQARMKMKNKYLTALGQGSAMELVWNLPQDKKINLEDIEWVIESGIESP